MQDLRPGIEIKEYQFDKIEKDIIEDFLMKENSENFLKFGVNKYSWSWSAVRNDEIGDYHILVISEFRKIGNKYNSTMVMQVIPVDKFGRIVQTPEQKQRYADRIKLHQDLEQKMMKSNIALQHHNTEKMPDFQPLGEDDSTRDKCSCGGH